MGRFCTEDGGTKGLISLKKAVQKLEAGFSVRDSTGRSISFTSSLTRKYMYGEGRKSGPDPDRLKHLSRAILAIQKSNMGINLHKDNNPPQLSYLHQISDKKGIIVFTDAATGQVRSFFYTKLKKLTGRHAVE